MKRNLVIDNLRGLAMLGVIGIHIGSFVLSSATPRLDFLPALRCRLSFSFPVMVSFAAMRWKNRFTIGNL